MNRTNHYWSVGAGALLLVAASCGGTEATTTSATPSTTVATTTTAAPATTAAAASPEQIATSFIEAKGSWDADAAEALLAADASVSDLEVPRHADYAAQYRLYRAVEWQWTVDECNETEAGPPATVMCTYIMENAWSRALEVGPIAGSMTFDIDNAQIVKVEHNGFNLSEFESVWETFRAWVRDNHPDDFNGIYNNGGNVPVYTPEAAELWEQFTAEFVALTTNS